VAQQLAALKSPDEKVDVQQGLKELGQDASDEHKALGDRSLLQKGADMIGGWFGADRSQLDTTLTNDQAALQKLQGEKNQMSAQDYNAAYLKIMGNLGPQYDTMYQNERNTDKNWSTAQDVVRDVAIAGRRHRGGDRDRWNGDTVGRSGSRDACGSWDRRRNRHRSKRGHRFQRRQCQ